MRSTTSSLRSFINVARVCVIALRDSSTAVFFWIETLSNPKSKMYGRIRGRTMENLILGSVIKIFAKRCMENYVWR